MRKWKVLSNGNNGYHLVDVLSGKVNQMYNYENNVYSNDLSKEALQSIARQLNEKSKQKKDDLKKKILNEEELEKKRLATLKVMSKVTPKFHQTPNVKMANESFNRYRIPSALPSSKINKDGETDDSNKKNIKNFIKEYMGRDIPISEEEKILYRKNAKKNPNMILSNIDGIVKSELYDSLLKMDKNLNKKKYLYNYKIDKFNKLDPLNKSIYAEEIKLLKNASEKIEKDILLSKYFDYGKQDIDTLGRVYTNRKRGRLINKLNDETPSYIEPGRDIFHINMSNLINEQIEKRPELLKEYNEKKEQGKKEKEKFVKQQEDKINKETDSIRILAKLDPEKAKKQLELVKDRILSVSNLRQYINNIRDSAEDTFHPSWGTNTEIQALSKKLNVNFRIFNVDHNPSAEKSGYKILKKEDKNNKEIEVYTKEFIIGDNDLSRPSVNLVYDHEAGHYEVVDLGSGKIKKIRGGGDCLYDSVVTDLREIPKFKDLTIKKLRNITADYLNSELEKNIKGELDPATKQKRTLLNNDLVYSKFNELYNADLDNDDHYKEVVSGIHEENIILKEALKHSELYREVKKGKEIQELNEKLQKDAADYVEKNIKTSEDISSLAGKQILEQDALKIKIAFEKDPIQKEKLKKEFTALEKAHKLRSELAFDKIASVRESNPSKKENIFDKDYGFNYQGAGESSSFNKENNNQFTKDELDKEEENNKNDLAEMESLEKKYKDELSNFKKENAEKLKSPNEDILDKLKKLENNIYLATQGKTAVFMRHASYKQNDREDARINHETLEDVHDMLRINQKLKPLQKRNQHLNKEKEPVKKEPAAEQKNFIDEENARQYQLRRDEALANEQQAQEQEYQNKQEKEKQQQLSSDENLAQQEEAQEKEHRAFMKRLDNEKLFNFKPSGSHLSSDLYELPHLKASTKLKQDLLNQQNALANATRNLNEYKDKKNKLARTSGELSKYVEKRDKGFNKYIGHNEPIVNDHPYASSLKYNVDSDMETFLDSLKHEYNNNEHQLKDENGNPLPERKAQALLGLIERHHANTTEHLGKGANEALVKKLASYYPKNLHSLAVSAQKGNTYIPESYIGQVDTLINDAATKRKEKNIQKENINFEKNQRKANIEAIKEGIPKKQLLRQVLGKPVISNINYNITGAGKVPDYVAQGMDAINRELVTDLTIPPSQIEGNRYVSDSNLHTKHLQDFQNKHKSEKLEQHKKALDEAHKVYTASLNPGRYDELDKGLDTTVSPTHHAELRNEYEAPLKEKFNQLNEQLKKNVSFTAGSMADTYARRFIKGGGRNHTAAASLEQRLQEKMLSKDLKHRRRLIEDAHHKTMAYAQNAQNQELSASQLKSANKQAKEKADLLNLQSVSALHNEHEQNDLHRMDAEKKLSQDAVAAQQRDIDAQIIENERSGAEKQKKLVQAAGIIQGVNLNLPEVRQHPEHAPSAFNFSQAPYQSRSQPQGGSGWEGGFGSGFSRVGADLFGHKGDRDFRFGEKKGGRVHKAGGGVLREAIDNAYLNHISSLQSLNNLERANILDGGRDKKAEGGSPIDRGSRIADKYAQQIKREALAKKLENPEEKGLLELLARGFFKGARDSGSDFLGAAPHAITAGFEENDKAEQAQLQKQLKAEELQSQFSKELQHEEEVAEAIRQKEQDHALHLRKQAHDEAYQGQHLAQMREDKMERYLADKDYRQEKLAKEDRAYELAKQKFEHELSPEAKAAVKSMEKQIDARNSKILQLESAPTGGIMGQLNTGFGLFDDKPKQVKRLKDEVDALEKERMRVIGGTHTKAHDLTTTETAPVKETTKTAKNPLKGDGGMLYKSFLDKRAKYAGGRVA